MATNYILPPIIQNWIDDLNNINSPLHIRDNYCMMLESVGNACLSEVGKFRKAKHYQLEVMRKKKPKRK